MRRGGALVALLVACGGGDRADHELVNAGVLCAWSLSDTGAIGATPFEVGRPVRFDLRYDVVTAACPVGLVATCEVDRSGTTLTFATTVTWDDAPAGTACTREAKVAMVTCEVEPLAAGSYVLRHGGVTSTLVMPSIDTGVCLAPTGAGDR